MLVFSGSYQFSWCHRWLLAETAPCSGSSRGHRPSLGSDPSPVPAHSQAPTVLPRPFLPRVTLCSHLHTLQASSQSSCALLWARRQPAAKFPGRTWARPSKASAAPGLPPAPFLPPAAGLRAPTAQTMAAETISSSIVSRITRYCQH